MPAKPYWAWTCHRCGHDDNRNTDRTCTQCNAKIRCEAAGGHRLPAGHAHCESGCGTQRNGQVDLAHRREDY